MIRRPPRSTLDRSSAASDVYKRQGIGSGADQRPEVKVEVGPELQPAVGMRNRHRPLAVSYTHLRAHETVLDLVCRLLLEKKKNKTHRQTVTNGINLTQNDKSTKTTHNNI